MTEANLIDGVLRRIDEATAVESGGIAIRYPIAEFLREATREILLTAPLYLLPKTDFTTATITEQGDGTGTVALPENYLRLASFRLRGWLHPATTAISTDNPLYSRQLNPVTRGGVAKPVVALLRNATGLALQWFSLPLEITPEIKEALCIVECQPAELPDTLANPLCWLAASLVLAVTNEQNAAATARGRYELSLQQL